MPFDDLLQAEAERLGFHLSGVMPLQPPSHLATFQEWIQRGRHGTMDYLASPRAIERRSDPTLIQPGAQSVIVVAMRYPSPYAIPDGDLGESTGRVAAYAWGEDYHEVIPPRLADLGKTLETHLSQSLQNRYYTDTGPILERDFAQQAGLGWIGKNTCLISPRDGSFSLLGELFVDTELAPSQAFRSDQCGSCRRCIDACPTSAILPDRTLDARRCISYLTIENKGVIPVELRGSLGEWVFGCDICQMVCPWNLRFAASEGSAALAPRPRISRPTLRNELKLTPRAFNLKFRKSPIQRARRRGYLRNVCVALGNAKDAAAVPDLAETLQTEPEPLVRAHAAWALGQLGHPDARTALEKCLATETDETTRAEIQTALAEDGQAPIYPK